MGVAGARLRGFEPGERQASRIGLEARWASRIWRLQFWSSNIGGALGFEDLGLEGARLRGFGFGGGWASRICAWRALGFRVLEGG